MSGKNTRMQHWLQYNVRVTLKDNRKFAGTLIAFDKHMNLVLADCEEFRMTLGKNRTEMKRTLGFVLIRGENIVAFSAKTPANAPQVGYGMGPGKATPAGRGAPLLSVPPGLPQPGMPPMPAGGVALQAPMRGLVGSAPVQMQPQNAPGTMPPMPN